MSDAALDSMSPRRTSASGTSVDIYEWSLNESFG